MNTRQDILNELNNIGPALIPLKDKVVFTVPSGYFEELPVVMSSLVASNQETQLPVAKNIMDVPAGYFDSLADNIISKIRSSSVSAQEELKELSPALSATGNDNVYTVHSRYFHDLPEIILSRVKTPARVIQMSTRSSFARYAAAAVITGIMGLGLFSIFDGSSSPENSTNTIAITDGKKILQSNSFNTVLESITDEEIVGYLQENGQDVKTALLAASIDTKELPPADAYITNENTLDDYLDEINLNDHSN